MRRDLAVGALLAIGAIVGISISRTDARAIDALAWAYPKGEKTTYGQSVGPGPFRVPGSTLVVTRAQFDQAKGPIDWHPHGHPPAPRSVSGPTRDKTTPCAECHLFNGAGFPAAADLAGLPQSYIVEQVLAFRSAERTSALAGQLNTQEMIKVARGVSPTALRQAAAYYSRLPPPRLLKVVETKTVPKTFPDKYGWLNRSSGHESEPIGDRVVELSEDLPRMMLYDDHVMLIDFVPPGAIERGRKVAEMGGGAAIPCTTCHGARLAGTDTVPPLAGRPAGYIARTLWDIRTGARHNAGVLPMRPVAEGLSPQMIRDLSAYLASLPRSH